MAEMKDRPVHFVHYEGCKDDTLTYNMAQYADMFRLFVEGHGARHFIVDRPHVGESVWAKLYKNYDGHYVFDLEKRFIENYDHVYRNTIQFFLFDTVDRVLERESARRDGYSYTATDKNKKQAELDAYVKAAGQSMLKTKIIWMEHLTLEDAFDEIVKEIRGLKNDE
jgi:hypothetical protein